MNRYEKERAKLPRSLRRGLQSAFRKALKGDNPKPRELRFPSPNGGQLRCLITVADEGRGVEEHISVSRERVGPVAQLPGWDDLVLVRALAWGDDVEVVQFLPALTGSKADVWVNVEGVEVLHLRRFRGA